MFVQMPRIHGLTIVFAQRAGTTVAQLVLHRQTRTICAAGGSAICLHLDMPLALLYQWMLPWTLGPLCCALSVSACHFALIDGGIPGQEHGKEFSSGCRGAWRRYCVCMIGVRR